MMLPSHSASLCSVAACAALLLGCATSAEAAACLYRGTDDSARVTGGGAITTPFPEAKSSPDCNRLRVSSGTVDVVVLGANRAAIASRRITAGGGSLVTAASAEGAAASDESAALLRNILVALDGDRRSKTGSSRSAEEDYLSEALPAGKLSEPQGDLVIVLGPTPDRNLSSFELLVDNRVVVHTTGPSREITLPAAGLKQGAHVIWKLDYAGQHLSNTFDVTAPERLASLKVDLSSESKGSDTKVAKLRLASGLIAAGYAWDARELIREAMAP